MCSKRYIKKLRDRWKGQDARIKAIIDDIKTCKDWTKRLLHSNSEGWQDLPEIDSCPLPRRPWDSAKRDLRGIVLSGIYFYGVSGFSDSCLDYCIFDDIKLIKCSLNGVLIRQGEIKGNCVIEETMLHLTNIKNTRLQGVSLSHSDFTNAKIQGADLRDSILLGTIFHNTEYNEELWFDTFHFRRRTRFGGEFQQLSQLGKGTSSSVAEFISRENLKWSLSKQYPILCFIWNLISQFGYSPARLFFVTLCAWLFFGFLYAGYPLPAFLNDNLFGDILCAFSPNIDWGGQGAPHNLFEPYYFSAVKMLGGYVNITPICGDVRLEIYTSVQAAFGYLLLAIFVTMLLQNIYSFKDVGVPSW